MGVPTGKNSSEAINVLFSTNEDLEEMIDLNSNLMPLILIFLSINF